MAESILLQAEIQVFIKEHENDDLRELMLQKEKYSQLPLREIIEQISCRQKAKKKLPTWHQAEGVLFPPPVSLAQTSSEIAAEYKASLFSGRLALDLTSGFGIDSYYLAKRFERVISVEENFTLAEISKHNFKILQQRNITVQAIFAESFLKHTNQRFDLVYLDPDRRPGNKRVTGFQDSKPNILDLLPELRKITGNILIKASPMLDVSLGIKQLQNVKMVIVVAVENEVKELLYWLGSANEEPVKIRCINLAKNGDQLLEYLISDNQQEICQYGNLEKYLYEPNAAIMKAGGFNFICEKYKLRKLHVNTHLYTSVALISDFPGRKFRVTGITSYSKKEVLPLLRGVKVNVTVRNFIDSPEQVKIKLGLQDGGDQYLFCFRNVKEGLEIAVCERV